MAHLLSKSTFIRGQQCQKSLYLNKKRPFLRDKISAEQLAKFRRGTDVGILAQDLFPGGVDCRPKSPSQYAAKVLETAKTMEDKTVTCIYEAVFQYDDVLIILDILVRTNDGWSAYEVKSSKKITETYLQDASLQYFVIKGAGVDLSSFNLIYINEDYELDTRPEVNKLFRFFDVTAEVKKRAENIRMAIAQSKYTLSRENSPEVPIGPHCQHPYPCDFQGHCWKSVPANSFLHMDTLEPETRFKLYAHGLKTIDQLPVETLESKDQQLQYEAFSKNKVVYDAGALNDYSSLHVKAASATFLKVLSWQPAVPFLRGMRPYNQMPLAVSLFSETDSNEVFITPTADGMDLFLKTISSLNKKEIIFTDDADLVQKCIETAERICHKSGNQLIKPAIGKYVDLHELIEKTRLYLPSTPERFKLDELQKYFSKKYFVLKKEVYLIADLLEVNDDESTAHLLTSMKTYGQVLRNIFTGISDLFNQESKHDSN